MFKKQREIEAEKKSHNAEKDLSSSAQNVPLYYGRRVTVLAIGFLPNSDITVKLRLM